MPIYLLGESLQAARVNLESGPFIFVGRLKTV